MIVFIHRKDLRTIDMPAWDAIARTGKDSLHVLILEPFLLRDGRDREHSGIHFLRQAARLAGQYAAEGKCLHVLYGEPPAVLAAILDALPVSDVLVHADYTPYSRKRDTELREAAEARGIKWTAYEERTLADPAGLLRHAGRAEPFKVFTPFYRRWVSYLDELPPLPSAVTLQDLTTAELPDRLHDRFRLPEPLQAQLLEAASRIKKEPGSGMETLIRFVEDGLDAYPEARERYGLDGTSRISSSLNTGSLSVRQAYAAVIGREHAGGAWLRQLAWRDFYLMQAQLNPDFFIYEQLYDESGLSTRHFEAWAEGLTGIPVIDAAMRQLNQTGWMPNRLRMITAMFLTKNLACPFRYGERYFRLKLADYDNTLNRGGWLWSSSLGFDAAPYFRVMNPVTQSVKYDPDGSFIRQWMPELAHLDAKEIHLPLKTAVVDLKTSRARAIEVYGRLLKSK
ncbi:cryptochrome/photolyase family protein [Paenibacillus sp. CN-4]|uniref:cryptochrome/photolyase family protein n=1 Tax=Paenibacillus nanchangensis TaxID=3348343 RepID=UPI003978B8C8